MKNHHLGNILLFCPSIKQSQIQVSESCLLVVVVVVVSFRCLESIPTKNYREDVSQKTYILQMGGFKTHQVIK